VILTVLHILQWVFVGICAPLLGLLLYALFKEWRVRVNLEKEYRRGYEDGYLDGFDAGLLARVMDSSWFELESDDGEVPT
jgi:hypothetical protein